MDLELLKALVAIDTSGGKNREEAVGLIVEAAERRGLRAEVVRDRKGIPNVVVEGEGQGKRVLFITHYDVVPPGDGWTRDPFKPELVGNKLYGRGAADDKSAIVAVLDAMASVKEPKVRPVLVVAGAEETGESEEFMRGLEGDMAVVVDSGPVPTIGASGVLKYTLTVKGKQAHSAYPFLGKNALYDAARMVLLMESFGKFAEHFLRSPYPGSEHYDRLPVRASATVVRGGSAWNIIPQEVHIQLSLRTVPGWNNEDVEPLFLELVKRFAEQYGIDYDIKRDIAMRAWVSEGKEVERFLRIYEEVTGTRVEPAVELGGTDGVHFADRMPVVQFGPMRPENNIHGPDEFVYLKDVEMVENVVRALLQKGI